MKSALAVLELSRIQRAAVKNKQGQDLGHIDDLIVNVGAGRIEYVRLCICGEKNETEKLVTIPWSQFRVTEGSTFLELNLSWEVLKSVALPR